MTYGEGSTSDGPERPLFEVVQGSPIVFTPDEISVLDETFGVPQRVAEEVTAQIQGAIAERALEPEHMRFSGYYDAGDVEHAEKAAGTFAGDEGVHEYFFTDASKLADGEEGPLAYAASGGNPGVGVYDLARLQALGYDDLHNTLNSTPAKLIGALLFEFRPQYIIDIE